MARFVAAVLTVIDGRVTGQTDPRLAARPRAASLSLAYALTERRRERDATELVIREPS